MHDSPLEGVGFELPVPRENGYRSESSGFVYLPETVPVSWKDPPTSATGLKDRRVRDDERFFVRRSAVDLTVTRLPDDP